MADKDIVTRLRQTWYGDDYAISKEDHCYLRNMEAQAAADEIERLRAECERLRRDGLRHIDTLVAERDEARREVCDRIAYPNRLMHLDRPRTRYEVAQERGWDCFKEDTNG